MRKLLAALGAAALVLVVLAGCGSSSSSSSSSSTATSASTTAVNASIAATVPAAIKSKGTLNVATEAQYAPERVHRARRPHGDRNGRRPDDSDRRGDGPESEHDQRQLRNDHPRPCGRPLRPRSVVVHRHERTREDRRLRRLLQGRHLVLREELGESGRREDRRPVRQDGGRREGHGRAGRSRKAEQDVHERRQEERHRAQLPGPEQRQPRGRRAVARNSAWPTRPSSPTRSSSLRASSS